MLKLISNSGNARKNFALRELSLGEGIIVDEFYPKVAATEEKTKLEVMLPPMTNIIQIILNINR